MYLKQLKDKLFNEMIKNGSFNKIQSNFLADVSSIISNSDSKDIFSYSKPNSVLANDIAINLISNFFKENELNNSLICFQNEIGLENFNIYEKNYINKNLKYPKNENSFDLLCSTLPNEEFDIISSAPPEVNEIIKDIYSKTNNIPSYFHVTDETFDLDDDSIPSTIDYF